ncbi:MAG: hypothetical protein L0387_12120 [Acidobacteria bacterium]|nr:hypothetical protein [Acidobacteriota bacterium]MCI0721305.1 hypothetical protein [Acidobacteriota bacterium]
MAQIWSLDSFFAMGSNLRSLPARSNLFRRLPNAQRRTTALNVLLLASVLCSAQPAFSQTSARDLTSTSPAIEQERLKIKPGVAVERRLAGGQNHRYRLQLNQGQFLHLQINQNRIDVMLKFFGPQGQQFLRINRFARGRGMEQLFWVAGTRGMHRLEVTAPEQDPTFACRQTWWC